MTIVDFTTLMYQIKTSIVPSRLVFIWVGPTTALFKILEGIDVHQQDLADTGDVEGDGLKEPQRFIENTLKGICKQFQETRNEPAALVLKNAILLMRYSCNLSSVFQYGISPRSAVIFLIPQGSNRHLPPKTDGWVKRNTKELIARMAKQLGTPNCIIDA